MRLSRRMWVAVVAFGIFIIVAVTAIRWAASSVTLGEPHLTQKPGARTLVVMMHGMGGPAPAQSVLDAARAAYSNADMLTFDYSFAALSNVDAYRLASSIEQAISRYWTDKQYEEVVLVGYSAGGVLLRKALVWAAGHAEDRPAGTAGMADWAAKVTRFVSVASLNRGWATSPRPEHMPVRRWLLYRFAERVARITGTGKFVRSLQRGAPFIADLRIQWIHLARERRTPFTVHLLGDIDDVVSAEDSKDLGVAQGTCFVTLVNTDHRSIVTAVSADPTAPVAARERYRLLSDALSKPASEIDCASTSTQEPAVAKRAVFLMHGIRDYGKWANDLRDAIANDPGAGDIDPIASRYARFPMGPFLLFADRQRNVRWFMDEYTEVIAKYADATVDFVGHSNGTYILASALQEYETLRVRNVYFAGSVVPQSYAWQSLIADGRVRNVHNVVGADDWVVAWFPRMFEQVAEWFRLDQRRGYFDIGAAGFRGFRDSGHGHVRNFMFARGGHGAGVDLDDSVKKDALVRYVVYDDAEALLDVAPPGDWHGFIDFTSNVCWLVWVAIAGVLGLLGWLIGRRSRLGLYIYVVVALAILTSV